VSPLDAWLASDDSEQAKEEAKSFWPAYLEDRDALGLALMSTGLTAEFADQGYRSGSLPDLDSLVLNDAERRRLVLDAIEEVRATAKRQRAKVSLDAADARGATLRVTRGLLSKSTQRRAFTITDFGKIERVDLVQGQ
jgi:hypothetical protein